MRDDIRAWLTPMVRELMSRPDPVAVLTALDGAEVPVSVAELVEALRAGGATEESLDWVAVGGLLREALGWLEYPAEPPSVN
ncbi:hypothetical protein [Mycobacteroides abscessus]|uniref:hypothetical protein n=1 Tax=Mycobacteroides abscessus TaxID=36809 RepID=UPI00104228C4|nr:hypothetical protein [Mycobacteroides abscessus]